MTTYYDHDGKTELNPTASYVQSQLPPNSAAHHLVGTTTDLYSPAPQVNQGRLSLSLSSDLSADEIRVSLQSDEVVVLSCKYLKAAKELLHEVVNVDNKQAAAGNNNCININGPAKNMGESSAAGELNTAEKVQEIQMKKAKLLNMLDQVEQRYKQYKQHMQMLTSWFEQMAGIRSSKAYTALALQTISKQFRNLKDAILDQIRSLGKEDAKMEGSRALQQLGMIHHNASSRQQRGLPEPCVSLLRAWLFQHFFHPYPKDLDKVMLAKQTGLTRSQVSNWFINARVRLWKPMVEELYAEEMKEHLDDRKIEQNDVVSSSNSLPQTDEETSHACFKEREVNPKKQPCNAAASMNVEISDGFTLTNFTGSYPNMEFGAPYSGNGVSLTLGLPHSGSHQTFLPHYNFRPMNTSSSASVYENINIQSPKRFGPTFFT